ncbi:MAG: oxidoreductase [Micavibrio sp.]|nr:oxidoreductase [Micavibrio sp.]
MKTWFITGISRGLGLALAEAALQRGDTVIGTVREGAPGIDASKGKLHVLTLEMTDAAAVKAAVDKAFTLAPRIDVVVNNAGHGLLGAFEDAGDADIERLFAVNVFGPMRVIRAALPYLRKQGAAHIINVTSIAGRAPGAGSVVYAATKSALEGVSQSLSQEVGPLGIKVTAVAPGAFRTDFLSAHSIRRSGEVSSDYAQTAGSMVSRLDSMAGKQQGDPVRGAEAILALVDAENPPVHLLLGSDALRRAREKLGVLVGEIDAWEKVTAGTDYPAAN